MAQLPAPEHSSPATGERASKTRRSSRDERRIEELEEQGDRCTKFCFNSAQKDAHDDCTLTLCSQLPKEDDYIVKTKAAIQVLIKKQTELWQKGLFQDEITAKMREQELWEANSCMDVFIPSADQEPFKKRMQEQIAKRRSPLTEQWGWFVEDVPHCRVSGMYHRGMKRLEICLLRAVEHERLDRVRDLPGWSPTVCMFIVEQHIRTLNGFRLLSDMPSRADLERTLQAMLKKHN